MARSGVCWQRDCRGFTLIEVMIVVVIISLATAIAVPLYQDALTRARRSAFTADTAKLYHALLAYHVDQSAFPSEADFDLETLAPLSTQGYFPSPESYTAKLDGGRLLIYVAPDVGGPDRQFIAVGRLGSDPSLLAAAVYSDLVGRDGEWADGVFIIDQNDLEEAEL